MSERYLHLCDVVDGRSDVPAGCFADGGSSIAAGLELLAALKGDSAHRTTGLAADEQTGAAETVEFLNPGENGHPEDVRGTFGVVGHPAQPGDPCAGAFGHGVVAVDDCDLPRVNRAGGGTQSLLRCITQRAHPVCTVPQRSF